MLKETEAGKIDFHPGEIALSGSDECPSWETGEGAPLPSACLEFD